MSIIKEESNDYNISSIIMLEIISRRNMKEVMLMKYQMVVPR